MRVLIMLALALLLAGCADGGGEGGEGTTTTTTTATGTTTTPVGDPQPIYINGTVTGAADCTVPNVGGTAQGDTNDVPEEAWNGTWELSKADDATGAGELCLAWSDGTTGTTSGTVPSGVDSVTVYGSGGQLGYALRIDPAQA